MKQMKLNLQKGKWGGRRPWSGKNQIHSKGVAHREREKVTRRTPLHVNFRYRTVIRNKTTLKLLKRAIIREFAKKKKITIRIGEKERWLPDYSGSHLLKLVSS